MQPSGEMSQRWARPGIGCAVFGIEPHQAFKQTDDDAKFRQAGDDGRIERFRFGVVDDGDIGRRLAADAAGEE